MRFLVFVSINGQSYLASQKKISAAKFAIFSLSLSIFLFGYVFVLLCKFKVIIVVLKSVNCYIYTKQICPHD